MPFTGQEFNCIVKGMALIAHMEEILKVLSNKAKYIQEIWQARLICVVRNKMRLQRCWRIKDMTRTYDYKYLVKMPMDSVTEENGKVDERI